MVLVSGYTVVVAVVVECVVRVVMWLMLKALETVALLGTSVQGAEENA